MHSFAIAILILGTAFSSLAETISIIPKNAVIVLPLKADKIKQFAASELAKHLKLITGKSIPVVKGKAPTGKYAFMVGVNTPDGSKKLRPEQAVCTITSQKTYFTGDDKPSSLKCFAKRNSPELAPILFKDARTGTLSAVYLFLEKELGVKWIRPGDQGIIFKPEKVLTLQTGTINWTPKLTKRYVWPGYNWRRPKGTPKDFRFTEKERAAKEITNWIWLRRMKMGSSIKFSQGHAFTKWWHKYGKDHPEYFALTKKGTRAPIGNPDRIKLCVSNPAVHRQIVANFMKLRQRYPDFKVINVTENDSGNYCECKKCRALDATRKGERFDKNLTDRYVWFANQVQRLAKKQVPNAQASMYAYGVYRLPPRKVKLDDGVILGFVPSLHDDIEPYYKGWIAAGAAEMYVRPNHLHNSIGVPKGFEKNMFDHLQIAIKYGIFGADYDAIKNYWPISGFATYIICRAIAEPGKSFAYWENEYCSAYGGAAAPEVKKYLEYWRENVWSAKFKEDFTLIGKTKMSGHQSFSKSCKDVDFDKTDAILKAGLRKKLSPEERKRLDTLVLANQHGRLIMAAMRAYMQEPRDRGKLMKAAETLLNFRKKHQKDLDYDWELLFDHEDRYNDYCGMGLLKKFKGLLLLHKFPVKWLFKLDPKNVGLKAQWQNTPWRKINSTWDYLSINNFWERAKCHSDLRKALKEYDGIGWYATSFKIRNNLKGKKLYLFFGAVDESCWIYINGKKAGKHLFKKPNDWQTPFKIRIDQAIDWRVSIVTVLVRVEDKAGAGGIWKSVWLVADKENQNLDKLKL